MATKPRIYIGNIPWTATTKDIVDFFSPLKVKEVKIITDRETQKPRGFAFVELESAADVAKAISTLDGTEMGGRRAVVNEANERPSGGGGGGGGNGHANGRANNDRDQRRAENADYAESWKK
jgi:RNA recognition motif-containing protein